MAQQRTRKCSHLDRNLLRNTQLNRKYSQITEKVTAITLTTHYLTINLIKKKNNNKCPTKKKRKTDTDHKQVRNSRN